MQRLPALSAIALIGMLQCIGPAPAQNWPTRPITMVVTFAAGSSDDVLGRILSPRLSELLGQQVIIENIGGAGGMNGVTAWRRRRLRLWFVISIGTFAANQTLYKNPLTMCNRFCAGGVIATGRVLTAARFARQQSTGLSPTPKRPGRKWFGAAGASSASHLACLMLKRRSGSTQPCPHRLSAYDAGHDRRAVDYPPVISPPHRRSSQPGQGNREHVEDRHAVPARRLRTGGLAIRRLLLERVLTAEGTPRNPEAAGR
jgi:tripartite-type tricarboxylate transporter receptor subunit TctC